MGSCAAVTCAAGHTRHRGVPAIDRASRRMIAGCDENVNEKPSQLINDGRSVDIIHRPDLFGNDRPHRDYEYEYNHDRDCDYDYDYDRDYGWAQHAPACRAQQRVLDRPWV